MLGCRSTQPRTERGEPVPTFTSRFPALKWDTVLKHVLADAQGLEDFAWRHEGFSLKWHDSSALDGVELRTRRAE